MLTIQRRKQYINRGVVYGALVLVLGIYPFRAFADDVTPPPTDQSTQTTATQPTTPTTTDSTATTQPAETTTTTPSQPAPTTTTQTQTTQSAETKPVEQPKNYYYDATNQRWNTDQWVYDPTSGTYKAVAPSPPQPKAPEAPTAATTLDATTKTELASALNSLAKTGDAKVTANTSAGSARTGDAAATATIINNVNSSLANANNTEAATFVSDVMGDVNGDIILQPMLLKAMLEAGAAQPSSSQTVNSTNETTLTNDVQLSAKSGDATVARNTEAGSATTGSAHTVADVINIVNSMIAANQSFMGTINIYGNLNGDILVAPDFLPKLLASNAASTSTHDPSVQVVNATDTQSIVNNVALAAKSGQAVVTENTQAGSAKSGDAMTNVVLFNLSGHDIVATNSLLVFINVLGKWVGVIVDAPAGTTAAAIGSGVTKNTTTTAPSLSINAVNTTAITNNIGLDSTSGNATVAGNTLAGDATTGNATASASIVNISNSQMGLAGWFGVLFINVFGTWIGSFGIDTSAGDPLIPHTMTRNTTNSNQKRPRTVIAFVPRTNSVLQPEVRTTIVTPTGMQTKTQHEAQRDVKAAQIFAPQASFTQPLMPQHSLNLPLAVGSLVITLTSLYLIRRHML